MRTCGPRRRGDVSPAQLGPRLLPGRAGFGMPFTTANGLKIHYERAGSGPPLLFISGTGGDLRVKPNVFDGPLAKLFDVLAYDQRGLGRSAKPDVAYSMADYADDAAALLDYVRW